MIYAAFFAIVACTLLGVLIGWVMGSRAAEPASADRVDGLVDDLTSTMMNVIRAEQAETMRATVDTVVTVASSKLGDQLEAGKIVIDRDRDDVASQVANVESELKRVGDLVVSLQKERAEQAGELSTGIRQAMAATSALADTTRSLREALASPRARGQWGERMAEDVLRAAGFIEGTNYLRQKKLATGGVPDYTFPLPSERVVHMDVKFPVDNYLRWLEAPDEAQRKPLAKAFRVDVRQRVKELTERSYIDPQHTVDYLLLFVPNESVYGFLHEHDPGLIDFALGHKVVLCSPTTLFAVLAVIRQSMDEFMVEQRSHEILAALGGLRDQWDRWCEPMDKMARGLTSAQKAFDELAGPRKRQFERQLEHLEGFRDANGPSQLMPGADGSGRSLRQVV